MSDLVKYWVTFLVFHGKKFFWVVFKKMFPWKIRKRCKTLHHSLLFFFQLLVKISSVLDHFLTCFRMTCYVRIERKLTASKAVPSVDDLLSYTEHQIQDQGKHSVVSFPSWQLSSQKGWHNRGNKTVCSRWLGHHDTTIFETI